MQFSFCFVGKCHNDRFLGNYDNKGRNLVYIVKLNYKMKDLEIKIKVKVSSAILTRFGSFLLGLDIR